MSTAQASEVVERPVTGSDYIAVPIAMLIPEKLCGVSLHISEHAGGPMRLFRGPEFPITREDIQRFDASGRKHLYISVPDQKHFQQYLRENVDELVHDETRSIKKRFATLNTVVRDVLAQSFQQGDLDNTVQRVTHLGDLAVDLICREDAAVRELSGVLSHDYHTFTHSANVSYYAVMLASKLGISDKEDLRRIASGALLHDLGKLDIPEGILTKPGRLDERERRIIMEHPTAGFRKICMREDLTIGQLMMVYQHHEQMCGGGYPTGVSGPEIHPWARLCTVVDVFEALTSNRPYRAGLRPDVAFQIMDRTSEVAFERSVYHCWKSAMTTG